MEHIVTSRLSFWCLKKVLMGNESRAGHFYNEVNRGVLCGNHCVDVLPYGNECVECVVPDVVINM